MDSKYRDLRHTIYNSDEEMKRFRQLVVNIVMATDICDKDLKEWRNGRWEKAFTDEKDNIDLKATIGIEHLIQAADVRYVDAKYEAILKAPRKTLNHSPFCVFFSSTSTQPYHGSLGGIQAME